MNRPRQNAALEQRWRQFLSHRKALERMLRRAVRSQQDAADMLQEIALVLARRVEVPDDELAFVAWCRAVARNVLMHHFRGARRRPELLLPLDAPAFQSIRDPSSSAERLVALRELLRAATGSLGESAWELLVLRYLDEENSSEIGTRLDEPAVSVRMRLSRLRAALRKQLVEYETNPATARAVEPVSNDRQPRSEAKRDSDIPPSGIRLNDQWSAAPPEMRSAAAKRARRR